MTKAQKNKLVKALLKKNEISRDEANYLIKTGLNMSVKFFCERFGISFRYLDDALLMRRPFNQELQAHVLKICSENFKGCFA